MADAYNWLQDEARSLREVRELAVSGTAVTLGVDLSFEISQKLFGAKASNLGNLSSWTKLGTFNINLHKTNHLVVHRLVMRAISEEFWEWLEFSSYFKRKSTSL